MNKYRVKVETNSVTNDVRYCVQRRMRHLFWTEWFNILITSDIKQAYYCYDKQIEKYNWK